MSSRTTHIEPAPVLGPNDPPPDYSRELTAYAKEEERLVRDYLGWWALVVGDEVIGAFRTVGEAFDESYRRFADAYRLFGDIKIMVKEIRDPNEPPDFMPLIDINHPSVRRLD